MVDPDFSGFEIKEETDFQQGIPSLKDIALMHIRKISALCCNEFTKGYWDERPLKVGGGIAIMRTYHPDQRAVFCNAVDFLLWIILPNADETFKNAYKEFKDEANETWEAKIIKRQEIFKDINLMFDRTNFFDSQTGRSEGGK